MASLKTISIEEARRSLPPCVHELVEMGTVALEADKGGEALPVARRALALADAAVGGPLSGRTSEDLMESLGLLSRVYTGLGFHDANYSLSLRRVAACEEHYGPESYETARAFYDLGADLYFVFSAPT